LPGGIGASFCRGLSQSDDLIRVSLPFCELVATS
jgi:hypothetical protein